VPLNAGTFGHHADGGERRTDAAVQVDGGFCYALPRLRLLRGATLEGVAPRHVVFYCTYVCNQY
jgi:hypothetical protein